MSHFMCCRDCWSSKSSETCTAIHDLALTWGDVSLVNSLASCLVMISGRLGALTLWFTLAVAALRAINRAWNISNRNSPAGWSSTQVDPCSLNGGWEGVTCLQTPVENSSDLNFLVVGL